MSDELPRCKEKLCHAVMRLVWIERLKDKKLMVVFKCELCGSFRVEFV